MGARNRIARLLGRSRLAEASLRARARVRVPYLTVLTYHHVDDPGPDYGFDPEVADATPAQFARQLDLIARTCNVVGIDELCGALDGEPLPPNPVLITFDDGYRSCHDVAVPMLHDRGMRAVFFIPTSFVDERRLFWWERIHWLVDQARRRRRAVLELAYPRRLTLAPADPATPTALLDVVKHTRGLDVERFLAGVAEAVDVAWSDAIERALADQQLMTWAQIRELAAAGMDIESHTRRHRVLATLSDAELDDELGGARADLERALGRAPRAIAYPVGRPVRDKPAIVAAVQRAGYRVGFTNATGGNWLGPQPSGVDALDLARIALDRVIGDDVFASQLAFPPLAYRHVDKVR